MIDNAMRERARGALIVVPAGAVLLAWPIGTYLVTLALVVLAAREAALLFGAFSGAASERRIALLLLSALFGGVISGGSALAALTVVALIIVAGEIYVLLDADEEHILERAHGLIADAGAAIWLSPLLLLPVLGAARVGFPAPVLAWLLVVVWSADTGAYLVGRRYGRVHGQRGQRPGGGGGGAGTVRAGSAGSPLSHHGRDPALPFFSRTASPSARSGDHAAA